MSLATRTMLAGDLTRLGLVVGDVVIVHASMRTIGKVLGGPERGRHSFFSQPAPVYRGA